MGQQKALYPSRDIDFTVETICELIYESVTSFEDVDYSELGLYLALNVDQARLEGLGLKNVCPKRRSKRGRPPTMTGNGIQDQNEKRFAPWLPPVNNSNDTEKRKMITEALGIVLKFIIKNHVYLFDNEIRQQQRGGPKGLEFTGVIAQLFMTCPNIRPKSVDRGEQRQTEHL